MPLWLARTLFSLANGHLWVCRHRCSACTRLPTPQQAAVEQLALRQHLWTQPRQGQVHVPMQPVAGPAPSPTDSHMGHLTPNQLKAEIAKLERNLQDSVVVAEGTPLRAAMTSALTDLRKELSNRRPAGQQLDQALAKEKSAKQARMAAEKHVDGLRRSLEAATTALQQARAIEEQATLDTTKIRAQLAEAEPPTTEHASTLPTEVTSAILGILRQAGVAPATATPLMQSLGFSVLPPPPPPACSCLLAMRARGLPGCTDSSTHSPFGTRAFARLRNGQQIPNTTRLPTFTQSLQLLAPRSPGCICLVEGHPHQQNTSGFHCFPRYLTSPGLPRLCSPLGRVSRWVRPVCVARSVTCVPRVSVYLYLCVRDFFVRFLSSFWLIFGHVLCWDFLLPTSENWCLTSTFSTRFTSEVVLSCQQSCLSRRTLHHATLASSLSVLALVQTLCTTEPLVHSRQQLLVTRWNVAPDGFLEPCRRNYATAVGVVGPRWRMSYPPSGVPRPRRRWFTACVTRQETAFCASMWKTGQAYCGHAAILKLCMAKQRLMIAKSQIGIAHSKGPEFQSVSFMTCTTSLVLQDVHVQHQQHKQHKQHQHQQRFLADHHMLLFVLPVPSKQCLLRLALSPCQSEQQHKHDPHKHDLPKYIQHLQQHALSPCQLACLLPHCMIASGLCSCLLDHLQDLLVHLGIIGKTLKRPPLQLVTAHPARRQAAALAPAVMKGMMIMTMHMVMIAHPLLHQLLELLRRELRMVMIIQPLLHQQPELLRRELRMVMCTHRLLPWFRAWFRQELLPHWPLHRLRRPLLPPLRRVHPAPHRLQQLRRAQLPQMRQLMMQCLRPSLSRRHQHHDQSHALLNHIPIVLLLSEHVSQNLPLLNGVILPLSRLMTRSLLRLLPLAPQTDLDLAEPFRQHRQHLLLRLLRRHHLLKRRYQRKHYRRSLHSLHSFLARLLQVSPLANLHPAAATATATAEWPVAFLAALLPASASWPLWDIWSCHLLCQSSFACWDLWSCTRLCRSSFACSVSACWIEWELHLQSESVEGYTWHVLLPTAIPRCVESLVAPFEGRHMLWESSLQSDSMVPLLPLHSRRPRPCSSFATARVMSHIPSYLSTGCQRCVVKCTFEACYLHRQVLSLATPAELASACWPLWLSSFLSSPDEQRHQSIAALAHVMDVPACCLICLCHTELAEWLLFEAPSTHCMDVSACWLTFPSHAFPAAWLSPAEASSACWPLWSAAWYRNTPGWENIACPPGLAYGLLWDISMLQDSQLHVDFILNDVVS